MNTTLLQARTAVGLHDSVIPVLERLAPPPASLLDLGAGTGALAQKLGADGYDVSAVDLDREHFGLPEVPFYPLDLNSNFSAAMPRHFDVITAVEVIEHVENPRHLLRQARNLLLPGGKILVTTPNIESVPGRIRFLRSGMFRMFDRNPALNEPTHISPIQTFMLERMLMDTGLVLVAHEVHEMPLRALTVAVTRILEPLVSGAKRGDNHIFVLGRTDEAKIRSQGVCV